MLIILDGTFKILVLGQSFLHLKWRLFASDLDNIGKQWKVSGSKRTYFLLKVTNVFFYS